MANVGRLRLAWMIAAAAVLLLVSAFAWPQARGGDTTLHVTTRLVNVNVVVTDAQGNPVKDLTREDFTVLDDGQAQKIAFFSAVDNEMTSRSAVRPSPDTFTNRPTDYGATPSVTVLLFDTLNSRWTSQGFGLHRIREFLRHIEPQDHIGIYVLGDELKVVQDFGLDSSDLVEAMRRYDEEQSHDLAKPRARWEESTGNPMLDRFLSGKDNRYRFEMDGRGMTSAYRRDRVAVADQLTTASLEAIARQLANVEGRKSLIWVTDSIGTMSYFDRDDLDEYLQRWGGQSGLKLPSAPTWEEGADVERMIRLMNGAGIAVYTVNASGLQAADLDFRNTSPLTGITTSTDPVDNLLARMPEPNPALLELASRTGGRAFFNRNDLETGIRRAEDDSRFSYMLNYYPDHNTWKGEWRKIQIRVSRPGATVLARGGYFALPGPRPIPPKNRFEFLSQIAASPLESAQLPLSVHIATLSNEKTTDIEANVHLDAQRLLTQQDNGRWTGRFEVVFLQLSDKNKVLDVTQKAVEADLDAQEYGAVSQKGWDLSAVLNFMHGAAELCVILHDKSSDAVGSVNVPLARYSALLAGRSSNR